MRSILPLILALSFAAQAADKKEQSMTPGGVYRAHDMQRPRPPVQAGGTEERVRRQPRGTVHDQLAGRRLRCRVQRRRGSRQWQCYLAAELTASQAQSLLYPLTSA